MKIKEQWNSYVRAVLPPSVGPVQMIETRRAFYAGAQAMIQILSEGVSDADEVTPGDMSLAEGLQAELEQFGDDVKSGRA
jgi:hypothetical protein